MALAEWTFDSTIIVTSQNDAPSGGTNPTLQLQRNTAAGFAIAGATINGQNAQGIRNGKLEGFAKLNRNTSGQAQLNFAVRRNDANNYYLFRYIDYGTGKDIRLYKIVAGVETLIAFNTITNPAIADNTWFKFRFTWWSAAGKTWFRRELAAIGGGYVQQGADFADSADLFTGATTGIAIGVDGATTVTASCDDLQIYRA